MSNPKLNSAEYVAKLGCHCPQCGSEDISGGEVNIDAGTAYQEMSCDSCNATWNDQYDLVGYSNLNKGE
jgi:transposase-like protein